MSFSAVTSFSEVWCSIIWKIVNCPFTFLGHCMSVSEWDKMTIGPWNTNSIWNMKDISAILSGTRQWTYGAVTWQMNQRQNKYMKSITLSKSVMSKWKLSENVIFRFIMCMILGWISACSFCKWSNCHEFWKRKVAMVRTRPTEQNFGSQ